MHKAKEDPETGKPFIPGTANQSSKNDEQSQGCCTKKTLCIAGIITGVIVLLATLAILLYWFLVRVPAQQNKSPTSDKPLFKNIDFLGIGYDIVKGNPHSTDGSDIFDPGYKRAIYDLSKPGKETSDGRNLQPLGTEIRSVDACSMVFQTDIFESAKSYSNSLENSVRGSVEYSGAKFSASTDYKRVEEVTENALHKVVESQASCIVYDASILPNERPRLVQNFVKAVAKLPATCGTAAVDMAPYSDFFEQFGTHVILQALMGARYGQQSILSTSSYNKMKSTGIKVGTEASQAAVWSLSTSTSASNTQSNNFTKSRDSQRIFAVGSRPPGDGSALTWAQSNFENPMPVTITVEPIFEPLTPQAFPLDSEINNRRNCLQIARTQYCEALKSTGKIKSCDPPKDIMPLAPIQYKILNQSQLESVWSDEGSGAGQHVDILQPKPSEIPANFFILGHLAISYYSRYCQIGKCPMSLLIVRSDDETVLAKPKGFNKVWDDYKTGSNRDGTICGMQCPENYVSLGMFAYPGIGTRIGKEVNLVAHYDRARCIKSDLVSAGLPQDLYKDWGSGGQNDLSIWNVKNADEEGLEVGSFYAHVGYSRPPAGYLRVLKKSLTRPV